MPANPSEPKRIPDMPAQTDVSPVSRREDERQKAAEVPQPPEYGEVLDELGPDEKKVSEGKC